MRPFSSGDRGRRVEPVIVSRRRITCIRSTSTRDDLRNAICTSRPSTASSSRLRDDVVAADHVEHELDAAAAGRVPKRLHPVGGAVVHRHLGARAPGTRRTSRRCRPSRRRARRSPGRAESPSCRSRSTRRGRACVSRHAAAPRSKTLVHTVKNVSGIAAASTSETASGGRRHCTCGATQYSA